MKILTLILSVLLVGCSSHSSLPDFTASGYLADRGVVRIWRKNSDRDSVHMMTVFTPFSGGTADVTHYNWTDGKLMSIARQVKGDRPDDVTLRFNAEGKLSFMQRQLAGQRQAVSDETVELYQFDAGRMRDISDALLAGRIMLHQGHWLGNGRVQSCEGAILTPDFDAATRQRISQMWMRDKQATMLAWLEGPDGNELLLQGQADDCQWQPREATF
jgi:hypothetical protein